MASVSVEPIREPFGPGIESTTYEKCFGAFIHATRVLRSGMCIPDLGSRIPDPTCNTSNKREGGNSCCPTFFVATNVTKFKVILFLNL